MNLRLKKHNVIPYSLTLSAAIAAFLPNNSYALPVDWHGTFGVDTTMISDFRKVKNTTDRFITDGSEEVKSGDGNKQSASWQSYLFRLNPEIIINDSATFKAEFTTGYGSGGILGDDAELRQSNSTNQIGDALYYYNQSGGKELKLSKAYLELYSDTATYLLGRHTYHWGLGALYSDGNKPWDRFSYSRDGITMKVKLGNFHVNPFWSKIANTDSLSRSTYAKEYGVSMLYDNAEKDIAIGLNYSVKSSSNLNATYKTNTANGGGERTLGRSEVKITDIYFKKIFNQFDIALEVPLVDGEIGNASGVSTPTKYSAKAILFESNYRYKEGTTYGFDFGKVDGNDSNPGQFDALYLNPNYQVANILFRYNLAAVEDRSQNIYDAYITNALYFKLRGEFKSEKWIFDTSIIYALANETATSGNTSYNHAKHRYFTANANQDDYLGTEIDLGAKYVWSNEITIGSKLGYLLTGDFYGFNNTATPNDTKNSFMFQVDASVKF